MMVTQDGVSAMLCSGCGEWAVSDPCEFCRHGVYEESDAQKVQDWLADAQQRVELADAIRNLPRALSALHRVAAKDVPRIMAALRVAIELLDHIDEHYQDGFLMGEFGKYHSAMLLDQLRDKS